MQVNSIIVNKYRLSYLDFSYKMYETGSVIQNNAWLATNAPAKVYLNIEVTSVRLVTLLNPWMSVVGDLSKITLSLYSWDLQVIKRKQIKKRRWSNSIDRVLKMQPMSKLNMRVTTINSR